MSNKRTFNELVLKWIESVADRKIDPETRGPEWQGYYTPDILEFPTTLVPRYVLEMLYHHAYGRKSKSTDIELALWGVHSGCLSSKGLDVYEEGIRFYLGTGRNPNDHWSAVLDREGAAVWKPEPVTQSYDEIPWSTRYPKGWNSNR
jgi:hypothetical protein